MNSTKQAHKAIGDYRVFYNNEVAVMRFINEIFHGCYYHFETDSDQPVILDCGSNIGVAALFFKSRYPDAKITCFEPDPAAFSKLEQNITINNLQNISLINAALSKEGGEIDFFGQVAMQSPDTRGNSTCRSWGIQRDIANTIRVQSVRLSDYIHSEVDLLKLNIEGAEQQVLEELGDKLALVKQAIIEVHVTDQMKAINNLESVLALLERYDFRCEHQEQNAECIWPDAVRDWVEHSNPRLYSIKAKRFR